MDLERLAARKVGEGRRRAQRRDRDRGERRTGEQREAREQRRLDAVLREQLRGARAAAAQRGDLRRLPLHEHRGDDQQVVGDDAPDLEQQHQQREAHEEEPVVEAAQHLGQPGVDAQQSLGRSQPALQRGERVRDRPGVSGVEPLSPDQVAVQVARRRGGDRLRRRAKEALLRHEQQVGRPGRRFASRARPARPRQ